MIDTVLSHAESEGADANNSVGRDTSLGRPASWSSASLVNAYASASSFRRDSSDCETGYQPWKPYLAMCQQGENAALWSSKCRAMQICVSNQLDREIGRGRVHLGALLAEERNARWNTRGVVHHTLYAANSNLGMWHVSGRDLNDARPGCWVAKHNAWPG